MLIILFMANKSMKIVLEQPSANEESVINLDLKCEEYNITTDEEFHAYLKTIIKQLEIPNNVVEYINFKYFRLKGTSFLSQTGAKLSSSILREAYESICKTIIKNENSTLSEDFPASANFIKKLNEVSKESRIDISISGVRPFEHKGLLTIKFRALDDSYWRYKYIIKFDSNYYLDDIYLDSKEMTHDSNGNAVPKPNSQKVDNVSYDLEILYLCLGNHVPEIWVHDTGDSDGSGYDLFHKEIALTENYRKNHQFKECLMPEKNYFYVDNAKNKDGIIANFEDGYVQLYAKFEDKDVLYDVKFETIDGYVDEINVATNSIVYKDNTSKDRINRMYNIHELNDIEYAGQNVFDD